jgi:hypothetical protein
MLFWRWIEYRLPFMMQSEACAFVSLPKAVKSAADISNFVLAHAAISFFEMVIRSLQAGSRWGLG